jgi:hypothetical protein
MRKAGLRSFMEITLPSGAKQSVATPIGGIENLSRPIWDYFLGMEPDEWFDTAEQVLKKMVVAALGDQCSVCGEPDPVCHEVQFKGIGGSRAALVFWNMLPVCRACHAELQERRWFVLWYDPLAGIEIVDAAGNEIIRRAQ